MTIQPLPVRTLPLCSRTNQSIPLISNKLLILGCNCEIAVSAIPLIAVICVGMFYLTTNRFCAEALSGMRVPLICTG